MVTSCKLLIINTQILRFFILFCLLLPGFVIFQKWQKFTIDQVIYAINGLRNSEKFTIARFFTIDGVTIARFDCTSLQNLSCNLANTIDFHQTLFCKPKSDLFFSLLATNSCTISHQYLNPLTNFDGFLGTRGTCSNEGSEVLVNNNREVSNFYLLLYTVEARRGGTLAVA